MQKILFQIIPGASTMSVIYKVEMSPTKLVLICLFLLRKAIKVGLYCVFVLVSKVSMYNKK
jgi:hypothetical protein